MQLLCPHCQSPVELTDLRMEELVCQSCGSSFRLETGGTTDWNPAPDQRRLGKFELLDRIGMGSFGTVYKARDPELDRTVAIKVPRAGHLADGPDLDRFLREARSVAQLRHPFIVPVYEAGQADGLPYLVSDFVEGVTLTDAFSARRFTAEEAVQLVAKIADALHYAHERGVVHRDVKPSNIMLDSEDSPHMMDFGLAKRAKGEVRMTIDGHVLGTPAYMSPEQAGGEAHQVDGRTDVYSLGVVLYELLTGRLPFHGTPRMLMHQVLNDEPDAPRSINSQIPRDLETVCLKCLRKEPGKRYATAKELADDLRRFLAGAPVLARRLGYGERGVHWVKRNKPLAGVVAGALTAAAVLVPLFVFLPRAKAPALPTQPVSIQAHVTTSPPETKPAPAEPEAPLPQDLALVPVNAMGFMSFGLANFVKSEDGQKLNTLVEKMKTSVLRNPEGFTDPSGLKANDIIRQTIVILGTPTAAGVKSVTINYLTKPYDRSKVLMILGDHAKKKDDQGRTFYVGSGSSRNLAVPPLALFFADERVFIQATAAEMPAFLKDLPSVKATRPFARALQEAAGSHLCVIGFQIPNDLAAKALLVASGACPKEANPLPGLQSGHLSVDLSGSAFKDDTIASLQMEGHFQYADEAAATAGTMAMRGAIKLARDGLRVMLKDDQWMRSNLYPRLVHPVTLVDPEEMSRFMAFCGTMAEGILSHAAVNWEGKTVSLRSSVPIDFVRLVNALEAMVQAALPLVGIERLETIHGAMTRFCAEHHHLPPPAIYGPDGQPLLSWRVLLLPYLGQKDLFDKFALNEPWDSPRNRALLNQIPDVFASPKPGKSNVTPYQIFTGVETPFAGRQPVPFAFGKVQANTLLLVEATEEVPWTKPQDLAYASDRPLPKLGGLRPNGFLASFGDGFVDMIRGDINEKTLRSLITLDGDKKIDRANLSLFFPPKPAPKKAPGK